MAIFISICKITKLIKQETLKIKYSFNSTIILLPIIKHYYHYFTL